MIITKTIVGRGEDKRYLPTMLESASKWADKMVFLADGDVDEDTLNLIKSNPKAIVFKNNSGKSIFKTMESSLRTELWEHLKTIAKDGDWIVSLDTDETFNANEIINSIIKAKDNGYGRITFRLIDLWQGKADGLYYRVDGYWSPRITRAYRYVDTSFGVEGSIHCGCIPAYAWALPDMLDLETRLIHYGWLSDSDKARKSDFYLNNTTVGDINYQHAVTIMHRSPTLYKLNENNFVDRHKVLCATLIKDRGWVLDKYLDAMEMQSNRYNPDNMCWYFIVNNTTDNSLEILKEFQRKFGDKYKDRIYIDVLNFDYSDNKEHSWNEAKLRNMAYMRNMVVQRMFELNCDAIFMVDTDIILQSDDTLRHMISAERDVMSEVFWAVWGQENTRQFPNVWINGGYHITEDFIEQLKIPGIYEVGGLGACSVYFKNAFVRGSSFERVPFLPADINGEDRDFCCRASVLGVKLFADTYKTPKHVEKSDLLPKPKGITDIFM